MSANPELSAAALGNVARVSPNAGPGLALRRKDRGASKRRVLTSVPVTKWHTDSGPASLRRGRFWLLDKSLALGAGWMTCHVSLPQQRP